MNSTHLPFFILLVVFSVSACSKTDLPAHQKTAETDSVATDSTSLKKQYANSTYDVSLHMPKQWILLEEPNLKPARGTFAINLFKRGTEAANEAPLHVHAKAKHTYVAIWPHGYGTELPASQYAKLDTIENIPSFQFDVNYEQSKALVLKNGDIWAYHIIPENPPEKWAQHGFIFAQIGSSNNSARCYDETTGEQIPLDRCDFLGGNRYVRQAKLDIEDAQTVRKILENISLKPLSKKTKASDLIEIEKPLPNMDVTSPLTVKGKARGPWYFEGSFNIELVDAAGNTLAETQARAKGKWMTDEFVPFEATLEFDAPDDERGQIIFHRANPSGLQNNAKTWTQPVIFPPK